MNKLKNIWVKFLRLFSRSEYDQWKPRKEILERYTKKSINPNYYGKVNVSSIITDNVIKNENDQPGVIYAPYKLVKVFKNYEKYKKYIEKNKDKIVKIEHVRITLD